ncbi:tetratricopeptide repeat protein [Mesohalobacter halotolerans]|uniref:Tetratricopeptide repeat protein n=1 Tax=Mesohalobacter halotolerans TaxID=1883405 RepID=A0A4U5TT84_9FLAO|nr:tetratricopeptide repeat protein [Mesohalobacter halotolerans]MBS3738355.1 tetratricopeptide repeat protein [Psychroflexus sp.]TKS57252.1 tetratricopeptide repeat protein [Mesohalobacter halotolerans]
MNFKLLTYLFYVLGFIYTQVLNAQIEQDLEPQDSITNSDHNSEFQTQFFKALSERGIENYEKATEVLESLKNSHPDKAVIYFQLGLNYFDLEQYSSALEHLKQADQLKPDDYAIREALFKVYEQQKDYNKAIQLARELAQKNPDYFKVLANLYLITKQYSKALDALSLAEDKEGFDPYKDKLREVIFETYNKPEEAIKYYKKRIKLQPYNPLNAYRLTTFLMQNEQYQRALETSKSLLIDHPRFTRAYVLKTQIHLKLDEVQHAFDALEVIVSDRFLEKKFKVQAIESIKAYVEEHPEYQNQFVEVLNMASQTAENSASFLDLGLFYFEKDKPLALKNFRKALTQNPQDFQILKYISVLELQLNNPSAAIVTAEQALEIFPTQAVFMVIKGQALLQQTQYKAAESVLLEAESYIFEENNLMLQLYDSLQRVYTALNEEEQSKIYQAKVKQLREKLK